MNSKTKFERIGDQLYWGLFLFLIIFCIIFYFGYKKEQHDLLLMKFSGVAEHVKYFDAKGAPELFIKEKKYFLSSFDWQIHFRFKTVIR